MVDYLHGTNPTILFSAKRYTLSYKKIYSFL